MKKSAFRLSAGSSVCALSTACADGAGALCTVALRDTVLKNEVVAHDILMLEVKQQCRVDRLTKHAGFEVEVRTGRLTCVTTQADRLTSANNLILLHNLLAQVTIERFKTIGVTNHDVVAITTTVVLTDAHLAVESSADQCTPSRPDLHAGVPNEDRN